MPLLPRSVQLLWSYEATAGAGVRGRAGVERGERVAQPPVYILVHLEVSVRREVVGVGQPLQLASTSALPVGGAGHVQRGRGGGVVPGFDGRGLRPRAGLAGRSGRRLRNPCSVRTSASGIESLMPRRYREALRYRRSRWRRWRSAAAHSTSSRTTWRRRDGDVRGAAALDRSLSCHITDLDVTFAGRLTDGRIEVHDTLQGPPPREGPDPARHDRRRPGGPGRTAS